MLGLILLILFSVTAASAIEDNQTDIVAENSDAITEEILTDENTDIGNFTSLNDEIVNRTGPCINLTKDYRFDKDADMAHVEGIYIEECDLEIDGNGHTIDASHMARAINAYESHLVLKNINFINGHSSENDGGAIYINGGSMTLVNCNFTGNDARYGAALYASFLDSITIEYCNFNENIAKTRAAVNLYNTNVNYISNCNFTGNSAKREAGLSLNWAGETYIDRCRFENNTATERISALKVT